MMGDKVFLSKTNFNTWLSVATSLDSKESVPKKSNYRRLIGNLIVFAINISNIVEYDVGYCCYIY